MGNSSSSSSPPLPHPRPQKQRSHGFFHNLTLGCASSPTSPESEDQWPEVNHEKPILQANALSEIKLPGDALIPGHPRSSLAYYTVAPPRSFLPAEDDAVYAEFIKEYPGT